MLPVKISAQKQRFHNISQCGPDTHVHFEQVSDYLLLNYWINKVVIRCMYLVGKTNQYINDLVREKGSPVTYKITRKLGLIRIIG